MRAELIKSFVIRVLAAILVIAATLCVWRVLMAWLEVSGKRAGLDQQMLDINFAKERTKSCVANSELLKTSIGELRGDLQKIREDSDGSLEKLRSQSAACNELLQEAQRVLHDKQSEIDALKKQLAADTSGNSLFIKVLSVLLGKSASLVDALDAEAQRNEMISRLQVLTQTDVSLLQTYKNDDLLNLARPYYAEMLATGKVRQN